jgi:hypothetical protein
MDDLLNALQPREGVAFVLGLVEGGRACDSFKGRDIHLPRRILTTALS